MKITAALFVVAVAVAGCTKATPPEVAVVTVETGPPQVAAECSPARDPQWADPPDAALKRADGARLWRANKDRFRALQIARRVCAASLAPHLATLPPPAGRTGSAATIR